MSARRFFEAAADYADEYQSSDVMPQALLRDALENAIRCVAPSEDDVAAINRVLQAKLDTTRACTTRGVARMLHALADEVTS